MKISAERKAQHREAILDAAAALLREKGPGAIGVAEVMDAAGLTHGGFYNHFASRDDMVAEAVTRAMTGSSPEMAGLATRAGLDGYLSPTHLADVRGGCPVAATVTEIARQSPAVREAFAEGLAQFLTNGFGDTDRPEALARLAAMVGALALARAVARVDEALALEVLAAVRDRVPTS